MSDLVSSSAASSSSVIPIVLEGGEFIYASSEIADAIKQYIEDVDRDYFRRSCRGIDRGVPRKATVASAAIILSNLRNGDTSTAVKMFDSGVKATSRISWIAVGIPIGIGAAATAAIHKACKPSEKYVDLFEAHSSEAEKYTLAPLTSAFRTLCHFTVKITLSNGMVCFLERGKQGISFFYPCGNVPDYLRVDPVYKEEFTNCTVAVRDIIEFCKDEDSSQYCVRKNNCKHFAFHFYKNLLKINWTSFNHFRDFVQSRKVLGV